MKAIEQILSRDVDHFLKAMHERFAPARSILLDCRARLGPARLCEHPPPPPDGGEWVCFADWKLPPVPRELRDRRVEISGAPDANFTFAALNSGARVFTAEMERLPSHDFEERLAALDRLNLATKGQLRGIRPDGAVVSLRPRPWEAEERGWRWHGEPGSATLFDFGIYFFHSAPRVAEAGGAPLFTLPGVETRAEARLWNEIFEYAQNALGLPSGTVRATIPIETRPGAFVMEEILHEVRAHAAGLQASFRVSDSAAFMRAYTHLLLDVCHKRGAYALAALDDYDLSTDRERLRERKLREARAGFDGTVVSQPELAPVALGAFETVLGTRPHQKTRRPDFVPDLQDVLLL